MWMQRRVWHRRLSCANVKHVCQRCERLGHPLSGDRVMSEQQSIPFGVVVGGLIAFIGFVLCSDLRKRDARFRNGYRDNAHAPGCLRRAAGVILILVGLGICAMAQG